MQGRNLGESWQLAYETLERAPSDNSKLPGVLTKHASALAHSLRESAPASGTFTGTMAAYHMGWTDRAGRAADAAIGKLVRPALCLWSCEACGGDVTGALSAATAIEWVHNFTLVHDDIQDGDRARRGRQTVWAIWGLAQGINAGDALFAQAFATLTSDGPHPVRRLRAANVIANAVLVVVEGQALDLAFEGKPETSLRSYLRMIRSKTGALIGASLEAGAVMGGASEDLVADLRRAGVLLGVAFQIRDDWLGTWGNPQDTGKSASGDLGRCKLTYPIVAAYGIVDRRSQARLRELFVQPPGPGGQFPVDEVRALLESSGGPALTAQAPQHFADKAIAIIESGSLPREYIQQFIEVAQYVANRSR